MHLISCLPLPGASWQHEAVALLWSFCGCTLFFSWLGGVRAGGLPHLSCVQPLTPVGRRSPVLSLLAHFSAGGTRPPALTPAFPCPPAAQRPTLLVCFPTQRTSATAWPGRVGGWWLQEGGARCWCGAASTTAEQNGGAASRCSRLHHCNSSSTPLQSTNASRRSSGRIGVQRRSSVCCHSGGSCSSSSGRSSGCH